MRKPLTDSLCAELAKDFKPFKVRLNPLKPKNGFKTSTTYRVTELRKNALHQWVIRFAKSKYDWLAENFDMIVETKSEPKRIDELKPKTIVRGLNERGSYVVGDFYKVDEDGFTWIQYGKSLMKLVAIETDPMQSEAKRIDGLLEDLDKALDVASTEYAHYLIKNNIVKVKPKTFIPSEPNPDNQTVNALVQYVSEYKESMSKESLMHFANLIGLIKLGAL
jgi:hypothetical protein